MSLPAQAVRLVREGSLPRSACSGALMDLLRPLLQGGVIVEERSGAGRRLVVRDPSAARAFVEGRFPGSFDVQAPTTPGMSRVDGAMRLRDSKAVANDTPEIVSLRAWHPDILTRGGKDAGALAPTRENGVFSFVLGPGGAPGLQLHGPCALVENPAVFLAFERLHLDVGAALYGQGRISRRLLDWLAAMPDPTFNLLHLPDYDPVGLAEHLRLRGRLGNRIRLHLPPDLDNLFARHSNRRLLDAGRNRQLLADLRGEDLPEVRRVVALIDRHNAALEQEVLLG